MNCVSEISLPVTHKVTNNPLTNLWQRVNRNEFRIFEKWDGRIHNFASHSGLNQFGRGIQMPFINSPSGAELVFHPALRHIEAHVKGRQNQNDCFTRRQKTGNEYGGLFGSPTTPIAPQYHDIWLLGRLQKFQHLLVELIATPWNTSVLRRRIQKGAAATLRGNQPLQT